LSEAGKSYVVTVDMKLCKRCGICIEFCPKDVYDADSTGGPVVAREGDCIGCDICVRLCPDFAIEVNEDG